MADINTVDLIKFGSDVVDGPSIVGIEDLVCTQALDIVKAVVRKTGGNQFKAAEFANLKCIITSNP